MISSRFRSMLVRLTTPYAQGTQSRQPSIAERGSFDAVLVRLIGNATIEPPFTPSQSLACIRFILEHEASHPGLYKLWVLNRLVDLEYRESLIQLLDQYQQPRHEIGYASHAFSSCWTDLGNVSPDLHPWSEAFYELSSTEQSQLLAYFGRFKSDYLINGPAAWLDAFCLGFEQADWVFPWDAHTYLTADAWRTIRPVLRLPDLAYVSVPVAPLTDRHLLLNTDEPPLFSSSIPLLGFSRNSSVVRDDALSDASAVDQIYPRLLGLHYHFSEDDPASLLKAHPAPPFPDRSRLVQLGWAFRLVQSDVELPSERHRYDALRLLSRKSDMRLLSVSLQSRALRCWTTLDTDVVSIPGLSSIAARALHVPPPTLADHPEADPGEQRHLYLQAVPHWQSFAGVESLLNRASLLEDGVPLCGDVTLQLDRARLQMMIDCVCALSLDGHLNGNQASFAHAQRLVRTWFIDPGSAMVPDGTCARLSGVDSRRHLLDASIDFRDFYPLLDALVLLQRSGHLSIAEFQQLEDWFDAFLAWLADDSSSFLRDHSHSPACTWYHLLMLAIAAFQGRKNVAAQVFDNLPGLLAVQFRPDGSPQSTDPGSTLRHADLFNLQAWTGLAVLSSSLGRDLLAFTDSNDHGLQSVFAYTSRHLPADPSCVDWLAAMKAICYNNSNGFSLKPAGISVLADASSGLPPFWTLCSVLSLA